jgi:acetyl esterase
VGHKTNANWISELAGKPVQPPRRETLQDLIDSRPFWLSIADLSDLPSGVQVREDVLLWDRGDTRLTAEVYIPAGEGPFPLLMHIHGGGYCTGGAVNDRKVAMRLAERGYVVISPEYSLAPEHPFPRAIEDCLYSLRWLVEHADELGGDRSRVVLEGGSAGAGLAVATMLALNGLDAELDAGDLGDVTVDVAAALLFYGMFSFPSLLLEPGSNVGAAELWCRAYLGPHFTAKMRHPLVSPVHAQDLDRLPPVYLACGLEDSMLGHTLDFVKELGRAGATATLSIAPGLDHSFVKLTDTVPEAAREVERAHEWLASQVTAPLTTQPR